MKVTTMAILIASGLSASGFANQDNLDLSMPVTELNSTALSMPPLEYDAGTEQGGEAGTESKSVMNKVALQKDAGKDIIKLFNDGNSNAGKEVRYEYEEVDEYGRPRINQAATQSEPSMSMQDIAKSQYKAVQRFDKVKPGANLMAPGAYGMQNRIQTNFNVVMVNTSTEEADAVVFVEDGFVYVTPKSDNPVDLLLFEAGVPESAFNITLVPVTVPPAMIEIDNIVPKNMRQKGVKYIKEQEKLEVEEKVAMLNENVKTTNSHVETIRSALTPIAQTFIPEGYTETTLSDLSAAHLRPCQAHVKQDVVERYIGSYYFIDVVEIVNTRKRDYLIEEQQCLGPDVIAVGVLEKTLLRPGEKTEMYILRDKFHKQGPQLRKRVRGER